MMLFKLFPVILTIGLSSLAHLVRAAARPNADLPNFIATKSKVGQPCDLSFRSTEIGAKHMPYLGNCEFENNEICSLYPPEGGPTIPLYCACGYRNETYEEALYPLTKGPNNICLGPPGYPCKSFPIGKKNHDKTCVSGICDLVADMCATESGIFMDEDFDDSAISIHSLLGLSGLCVIFLVRHVVVVYLIKVY